MEGSASANDDGFSTFFSETGNGKHVPRSLYVSANSAPTCHADHPTGSGKGAWNVAY
jgi:hypothetical protein